MRLVFTILLLAAFPARAHQIDEISMKLETSPQAWRATLLLDAAYMLPEYRGDAEIAPFDLAWLRTRSPAEWARIREEARRFLDESLSIGEGPREIRFTDFDSTPPRFIESGVPEELPEIEVVLSGPMSSTPLRIGWKEAFGVVLIIEHEEGILPLVSGESLDLEPEAPASRGFIRWITLGFRHILPRGLDHILFILGVFLLSPKWKPLLYQSLTFTLAHSVTLAAAALGWVSLPDRWVETAIALSIAWIAIENLLGREIKPARYAVIAGFGLIHGLGFARMLALALPDSAPPLWPLVGFNLGVEIGQLAVLGTAWALTAWWKDEAFGRLRTIGSIGIALVGLAWAIERAFLA
ncbi:HupE/UreJ family protein [Haloferula sp. A504]|uniref:HupE/UreJ family protein n=1 Tax=Haloferula sp. A504 TaxID=3373601 RepID=UPI0031C33732|nr:HupE/UreJ family protein [Verrucomicrobiaceae bacterium E54]